MNAPQKIPEAIAAPVGILAELTHRCPLACPYCSNPVELDAREGELDTETWKRVFSESAAAGVLHAHLSGGEPASRRDLTEIVKHCHSVGLYTNLITSGVGINEARMRELADAGLDHVQLSIQDAEAESADRIGGYKGGFARKMDVAKWVNEVGIPLTVNAVIHRANIARAGRMVEFAYRAWRPPRRDRAYAILRLGLSQPAGADALACPDREGCGRGRGAAEGVCRQDRHRSCRAGLLCQISQGLHGRLGQADAERHPPRQSFALSCRRDHSGPRVLECARSFDQRHLVNAPAFNAFRGEDWMVEPCRSCPRKSQDHGGCRCQALALTGDARNADPICHLSPFHDKVAAIAATFEEVDANVPVGIMSIAL